MMSIVVIWKGESLRQQLLVRYCGDVRPSDLMSKDSLTRQVMSASSSDCGYGSSQLIRAGMTLHDVQVC